MINNENTAKQTAERGRAETRRGSQSSDAARIRRVSGAGRDAFENRYYKQKPPVVVRESPRSQAPVARFSAFHLPISRGKCTRRTAPAPLTHRTSYPRCSDQL
ncbi:unnamed protein product, partial [Brenthis ino]